MRLLVIGQGPAQLRAIREAAEGVREIQAAVSLGLVEWVDNDYAVVVECDEPDDVTRDPSATDWLILPVDRDGQSLIPVVRYSAAPVEYQWLEADAEDIDAFERDEQRAGEAGYAADPAADRVATAARLGILLYASRDQDGWYFAVRAVDAERLLY